MVTTIITAGYTLTSNAAPSSGPLPFVRGLMATARASAGLAYPDRFYAAATYAGFGGSPHSSPAASRFQNDVALLLHGLYQQVGSNSIHTPCICLLILVWPFLGSIPCCLCRDPGWSIVVTWDMVDHFYETYIFHIGSCFMIDPRVFMDERL